MEIPPSHFFASPPVPVPIPLPQMPSFQQQTGAQPVQQPSLAHSSDSTDRARAYKSRNKRPCDFCRYKKAACHLESQPPCELCIRYGKECTFIESPAKRRRPNDNINTDLNGSKSNGVFDHRPSSSGLSPGTPFVDGGVAGMSIHGDMMGWDNGMPPFHIPDMSMAASMGPPDFGPFDPALYQDTNMAFEPFAPPSASTGDFPRRKSSAMHLHSPIDTSPSSQGVHLPKDLSLPFDATSGELSLDDQASSNAQIVGISGESDPYLLSRIRYDQYNEANFQSIRMRKLNDGSATDGEIPAFFTIAHNALASKAQPPGTPDSLDKYRRQIEEMISDDVGRRLIRLFYKYVQPYFPIMTREGRHARDSDGVREPSGVSTCVLAAIYGHALPFCAWDEKLCVEVYTPPSADALFHLAWLACLPCLHTPSLNVLQTLLLLVQRRPTNKYVSDTPYKWVMMGTAVSIAQSLGLNRDPSSWALPDWEIRVRKRLAWATFTQDKWLALNFGRSSHIQADDWDVSPLTEADFADADRCGPDAPAGFYCQHFVKLCELTVIVDEIMHSLFSLRATKALQGSLEATLEVAKPLRIRLTEWYQSLPPGLMPQPAATSSRLSPSSPDSAGRPRRASSNHHELDGNGSLHLAYITAKIQLFRAMLRPQRVVSSSEGGNVKNAPSGGGSTAAISALRTGALAVAKETFEFLEGLEHKELEAFWASYARTNFTIASSFMLLLFVTSPTLSDAKECLALLNAWRSLLRIKSRSCDLLNLALLRLDGVFVKGMEELVELSPEAARAWAESREG